MTTNWARWFCLAWLCLIPYSGNAVTPMVAAGSQHSIGLDADGKVYAWGSDQYGQLGLGRPLLATVPQIVPGLNLGQRSGGPRMAAGIGHNVTVKSDGSVWAWGDNTRGQLGDGTTTNRRSPVKVPSLTAVVAVAAGNYHTLALKSDGSVWAWGYNFYGQLGNGTTSANTSNFSPVQVRELGSVVAVAAAGYGHSIALKADGSVWLWGLNYSGQLGDGTTTDRLLPTQVAGLTGVVAVAAGDSHTLAVKSDGSVWSWGDNRNGRLGDGTTTDRLAPVPVSGITGVVAVEAGFDNSLALKSDGTVWTWGGPGEFRPPSTSLIYRSSPTQVQGLADVMAIAVGTYGRHSVALKSDGSVWAMENNGGGQLGDGTTSSWLSSPVQVNGLTGVLAVAAGQAHTLALKSDGSVWAWGDNTYAQLGDGAEMTRAAPSTVPGLTGVVAVAVAGGGGLTAGGQTFALKSDGTVWAWGSNVGSGSSNSSSPVQVQGLNAVAAVSAGAIHSLALTSDGSVWAWGNNAYGQLGDGTTTNHYSPVQVPGLTGVAAVAAGLGYSLALKSDGSVWAWGWNYSGQLGDGTNTPSYSPRPVPGLGGVVAVAAGWNHALAVKSDGSVWAWGYNARGELGDGTISSGITPNPPKQVPGLTDVVAVAAGGSHSLALKAGGSLWAWGDNSTGELGDGTTTIRPSPIRVPGLTGVTKFAAGLSYSLALTSDGSLWAWGDNAYGQLGNGGFVSALTPQLAINETVTGTLDLNPTVANNIPPSAIPRIILGARRIGALASLTLGANVYFGAIDLGALAAGSFAAGGPYNVYVAAVAPSGGIYLLDVNRNWSLYSGGPLPEYVSNATLDATQHYYVSILDGADLTSVIGARFLVGYGTDDQEMLTAQRYREIYVAQPDPVQ